MLPTKLEKKMRSDSFQTFSSPQASSLSSLSPSYTHLSFSQCSTGCFAEICSFASGSKHSPHLCIDSSGQCPTQAHTGKQLEFGTSPAELGSGHSHTLLTVLHTHLCSVPSLLNIPSPAPHLPSVKRPDSGCCFAFHGEPFLLISIKPTGFKPNQHR